MLKKIYFLLSICLSTVVYSQQGVDHHGEIGFGIGGLNYVGDISPKIYLKETRPAFQVLYRHNLKNNTSVLRINLLTGRIFADESKQAGNPLGQSRKLILDEYVSEIGFMYEYNFFDYRNIKKESWFSPYLLVGGALTTVWDQESKGNFALPFGVGLKYVISRNININVEYRAAKVFGDGFDGAQDDKVFSSSIPNDWYHYLGLNFTYTIYNYLCPEGHPKRR